MPDIVPYRSRRSMAKPFMAVFVILAVAAASVGWWLLRPASQDALDAAVTFQTFRRGPFVIRFEHKGELVAINNINVACPVVSLTNRPVQIQKLVAEGSIVKKGEEIVLLDGSEFARLVKDKTAELDRLNAELKNAQEQLAIQKSRNQADLEAASVELEVTRLQYRELEEGTHPTKIKLALRAVEMAKTILQRREEELRTTRQLNAKDVVPSSDVKRAELEHMEAQSRLIERESELEVLQKFTIERERVDARNKVTQAQRKLARVESENASTLNQRVAEVRSKDTQAAAVKQALDDAARNLQLCSILAPADGIVVYGTEQRMMFRDRPIAVGTAVQFQETILRLPDLTQMKVTMLVPELLVRDLKDSMPVVVRIAGSTEEIPGTIRRISTVPDNQMRWLTPDANDYPVEVAIERSPAGLRPGMSARVVAVPLTLENQLAVPVAAVYSVGTRNYVFVRDGREIRPCLVTTGRTNRTHVIIASGLEDNAEVAILGPGQGRRLLERAGVKPDPEPAPATRPAA